MYDIIVIGGGHAGIEAASISAKMGCSVLLLSLSKQSIGRLSCNPAIGGVAKGQMVREVDALGGVMGLITDTAGIQFRMLNRSKGPAVWSPRAQADRDLYSRVALEYLLSPDNVTLLEDMVVDMEVEDKKFRAVVTSKGRRIPAGAVIITSGTFLNGLIHIGLNSFPAGRAGELPATGLTDALTSHGMRTERFKTGTPPRIDGDTVDWSKLSIQYGDDVPSPFSFQTDEITVDQIPCHLTYTNKRTHEILKSGFERSPLFSGKIISRGPRYCPSVEDKVFRFADKERHQIFLEPEGLNTSECYVNGFSTSMPEDIQERGIHSIEGLETARISRYGYAVEYDYFPPDQLKFSLECSLIENVFLAGQVNGTSGYEEAAGQGTLAGINAALKLSRGDDFILKRSEAYLGVMVDDLVTKSVDEPYRMFTSRAEYRLLLRQDNADERLMKYGYKFGTIPDRVFKKMKKKGELQAAVIEALKTTRVKAMEINSILEANESTVISDSESLYRLLKRPEIVLEDLWDFIKFPVGENHREWRHVIPQIEMEVKYEGYILRHQRDINKMRYYENILIPNGIDYTGVTSLSKEAREKLNRMQPRNLSEAWKISGIKPTDMVVLLIHIEQNGKKSINCST